MVGALSTTTEVSVANCDIYIESLDANAQASTELQRNTSQAGTFLPLKLKVMPFVGTNDFSAFNTHWLYNGNPLTGVPNTPSISVSKPGDYTAVLSLKLNPANICQTTIHLTGKPCNEFTKDSSCVSVVVLPPDGLSEGVQVAPGDKFTAADYTVVISEITSGGPTGWYGKGYVAMKLPLDIVAAKIGVRFKEAVINDCYELAAGKVITEYDPNWGGILDLDGAIDETKDFLSDLKAIYTNVYDEIEVLDCSAESKSKVNNSIKSINDINTNFVQLFGFSPTEAAPFQNKLSEISTSLTCKVQQTCPSSGGRVSSTLTNCAFDENKEKFEELFCELIELTIIGENVGSNTGSNISPSHSDLVAYFTPSGRLVYLPKRAIPSFGTSTNLPIHPSALVWFILDDKTYIAKYSKALIGDYSFVCYLDISTGIGYKFEDQPTSIETSDNKLAYSLILGATFSSQISAGTLISTLSTTLESLEFLITQGAIRSLGLGISVNGLAFCTLPLILHGDQNSDYGAGTLEPSLPAVRLPVATPINISIDIDHALPIAVNGNCNVYVIWGPNFRDYEEPPRPIEVAKYEMTRQDDCNSRPAEQVRDFNKLHNVSTFNHAIIFSNLDKPTAHLLEKSLTAVYIGLNDGQLPPKHNLPCFKKDDIFNLIGSTSERVSRAKKWLAEQIAKYGK